MISASVVAIEVQIPVGCVAPGYSRGRKWLELGDIDGIEGADLLEALAILVLLTIFSSSGTLCHDAGSRCGLETKSSQDRDQA